MFEINVESGWYKTFPSGRMWALPVGAIDIVEGFSIEDPTIQLAHLNHIYRAEEGETNA